MPNELEMTLSKIHKGRSNSYLKKYWVIENLSHESNRVTDPMISDGCLEIMIIEGNGLSIKIDEEEHTYRSGIYLTGQLDGKGELCIYALTKVHFVKLYPWANCLITNFSLLDVTNKCIPFSELNKSIDAKLKHLDPSAEMSKIIYQINQELEDKSKTNSNFNILLSSCHKLTEGPHDFRTMKKEILSDFKISSKTLENKFNKHVGLTPKQFSMTITMRKIIEELAYKRTDSSLTTIALENGFFDQSHFIRSFRALFDASPSQLILDDYFIPDSKESFRYYTI